MGSGASTHEGMIMSNHKSGNASIRTIDDHGDVSRLDVS